MFFLKRVSFAAGAVLLAGGGCASHTAWTTNKKYLPVAARPVFAGLQQLSEGVVWSGTRLPVPGFGA